MSIGPTLSGFDPNCDFVIDGSYPFLARAHVVDAASSFIFVANAANTLAKDASASH